MSCQDDLTAVDLHSGVAVDVLERVSAVRRARAFDSDSVLLKDTASNGLTG